MIGSVLVQALAGTASPSPSPSALPSHRVATVALLALVVSGISVVGTLSAVLRRRGTSSPDDRSRRLARVALVMGIVLLALTAFVVLEPLIWRAAFGVAPPTTVGDLSGQIGVVVTIMSLLAATIGVVVYQLANDRLQSTSRDLATQLRTSNETVLARAGEDVTDKVRLAARRSDAAMFNNISYLAWVQYEQVWADQGYGDLSDHSDIRPLLEFAIDNSKLALGRAVLAIKDDPDPPLEAKSTLRTIRSSLAYHLATRRDEGDRRNALSQLEELGRPHAADMEMIETFAWVYCRFDVDPAERKRLLQLLRRNIGDYREDLKNLVVVKYRTLFAVDLLSTGDPPAEPA